MLPPLHPRQYSISSSPLFVGADTCTLTYSVLNQTTTSTPTQPSDPSLPDFFPGAASSYLASLRLNDRLWASVRPSHPAFHMPPKDDTPIVMVCAGSGLAPFIGFVQERLQRIENRLISSSFPPLSTSRVMMSLFIGCRYPKRDALYAAELRSWADRGAVDLRYAFSEAPDRSKGCRYVQERLWRERVSWKSVVIGEGEGKMFVCGNRRVVDGIGQVVVKTYEEEHGLEGDKELDGEAKMWFRKIRNKRFVCDVFD